MVKPFSKKPTSTISAFVRKDIAKKTSASGVKNCISYVYDSKWEGFRKFCIDENLQMGNGTLDPSGSKDPTEAVFGKIVEYFHYKLVEMGCDPGEVFNIRSALASIYRRKHGRVGEWKVLKDGGTEGTPTNAIVVNKSVLYYKREKKKCG